MARGQTNAATAQAVMRLAPSRGGPLECMIMKVPDGGVTLWSDYSIPQGQRCMFAGNEAYSMYVISACHLVLPRALARLNPAVVDSQVKLPSRAVAASFSASLSSWPWSGVARPVCPVAARPRSQRRARATGFGAIRRFVPSPVSVPAGASESPKWLGTPPVVPRLGVTRKKRGLLPFRT